MIDQVVMAAMLGVVFCAGAICGASLALWMWDDDR